MSSEPNYPASFYARLFDLSERRIQQMAKDGIIPKAGRGKYPLLGTVQGYVKFLQERALKAEGEETETFNVADEKAKLIQAKRIGQDLQNEKLKGNLFPLIAGEYLFSRIASEIAAVLDSLPAKIKRVAPKMTATQVDEVKKEIAKATNACANVVERLDEFLEEHYSSGEK